MAFKFNGIDGSLKISDWLQNGLNQEAIKYAESFGKDLKDNGLSTSQIRNVFSEIKSLQMKGPENFRDTPLLLLKPKLAYSKARKTNNRNSGQAAADLETVLSKGIDIITTSNQNKYELFQNFANFFEAILAYHRAFGGK
jgi:CRISPR-associated protein Csm2